MCAFIKICWMVSASLLLSSMALAAPPWMPEYELSGRLTNVPMEISGRRPYFAEKFTGRLPDHEDEPKVGRRVSPKALIVGECAKPLTNPVVARRVSLRENYVGRLPDLEDEAKTGRLTPVKRQIVGRLPMVQRRVSSQFPTPKLED